MFAASAVLIKIVEPFRLNVSQGLGRKLPEQVRLPEKTFVNGLCQKPTPASKSGVTKFAKQPLLINP